MEEFNGVQSIEEYFWQKNGFNNLLINLYAKLRTKKTFNS
jgi:hypothetical protein